MAFYAILAVALLTLLRSGYAIERQIYRTDVETQSRYVKTMALGAAAISPALWDFDTANLGEVLGTLLTDVSIVKIEVFDAKQQLLISKEKAGYPLGADFVTLKSRELYSNSTNIGTIRMYFSSYVDRLRLYQAILVQLIFSLLELVVIGMVLSRVAKRITNPVTDMVGIAENIAKGNLNNVFKQHGKDEIGRLSGALEAMQSQIFEQINSLENDRTEISALYEETAAMNEELESMLDRVNGSYEGTIKSLANAIEASDEYTKGHCERVELFSLAIGKVLDLGPTRMDTLSKAAILHDIGKIGVPKEILNKETPLTNEEFEHIKKHSTLGYQILKEVEFLKDSVRIILQHHERFDGTGYPQGIEGEHIDLMARILSVADAYDAMTSSRAYRKIPLSHENAMAQLREGAGKQFDPDIVTAFERSFANAFS